jgi:hypothetical protein
MSDGRQDGQFQTVLIIASSISRNNTLAVRTAEVGAAFMSLQEAKYCHDSLENAVFCDIMSCGSCKNRRFGQTNRLRRVGDKIRRAMNNVSSN